MALESFMKEKNVEPKVEWDGKDFRGETISPKSVKFLEANPKVFEWVKHRPRNSIQSACKTLEPLCEFLGLTPQQFIELDKKTARDKAWQYIGTFKMQHPAKAVIDKNNIQSFYYYHVEEKLPFILGKHDIVYELKRIKYSMDNATCWKIIHKAKNLRNETILIFAFESGLRRNAITHLTFGHYKNFMWFKKTEDRDVAKSSEREGNIALFKVMAKKTKQFVDDDKLRGKNIHWYYGCLGKEATEILKEYVAQYHQDSKANTPLWYSRTKNKRLGDYAILKVIKSCIERAGLPKDQINFHAFRRGFMHAVRNTAGITDPEFKQAIMGHKLKGSQEAYFDKDPLEFAREYAKCDFSEPNVEKDRALAQKEKENERLREQLKTVTDAQIKTKKKLTIPCGPLGGPPPTAKEPSYEEPKRDFQQAKPHLPKSEPNTPPLAISKPSVSMKQLEKDDWAVCPDKDGWVRRSVECKKCGEANSKSLVNATKKE